jgi:hypothetical protein
MPWYTEGKAAEFAQKVQSGDSALKYAHDMGDACLAHALDRLMASTVRNEKTVYMSPSEPRVPNTLVLPHSLQYDVPRTYILVAPLRRLQSKDNVERKAFEAEYTSARVSKDIRLLVPFYGLESLGLVNEEDFKQPSVCGC